MNNQTPELIEIAKEMRRVSDRLDKASKSMYGFADQKAEKEREYRMRLSQEIMKVRATGLPATLVLDVAKGNVADLKYERDLSADTFKAAIESLGAIKVQASLLQSIHKRHTDL
ncbi:hypothetical protein P4639_14435 [Priestia megaterium]|uniref:hypothetical protein n=1 Tax=Priestia megaterium TaxID=1404 RepID=UPI002E1FFBA7|nr:hypothetical protein [Priestia megaterium]